MTTTHSVREPAFLYVGYLLLLVGAVASFLAIRQAGQNLVAPAPTQLSAIAISTAEPMHSEKEVKLELPPSPSGGAVAAEVNVVFHVLATLAAIIGLGNLIAWGFRRIGQPAVIGEVVAGIVLGPSLLGAIAPSVMHLLIPTPVDDPKGLVVSSLKTIAQLGVVLYMFIVGLELNTRKVGRNAQVAIAISHASIVVPFILGAGLSLWLYPILSTNDVSFTSFSLFIGIAMSITAFPVLARILTDHRLEQTDLGTIALSCAASDDVTAWCLLAFVVGVAQSQIGGAVMVVISTAIFIALMFVVVRPIAVNWVHWAEPRGFDRQSTPILFIALLCSSLITEQIGIHAVFGAFLLGAIIPHDSRVAQELSRKLYDVVTVLLLPAFFAITGMNTKLGLISGAGNCLICVGIILVATLGKCGGTIGAARVFGVDWRTSTALGVLMNTRGLMELIVLNIGLSLGVISPTLFAMMVIMALVTTIATAPILHRLIPSPEERR